MTLIRVDPPLLRRSSQGINGAGQGAASMGSELLRLSMTAPSYHGQFGPRVANVGQEANARGNGLLNNLLDLGGRLHAKADEFEAADLESQAGLGGLGRLGREWASDARGLEMWAGMLGVPVEWLRRYLALALVSGTAPFLISLAFVQDWPGLRVGMPVWTGGTYSGQSWEVMRGSVLKWIRARYGTDRSPAAERETEGPSIRTFQSPTSRPISDPANIYFGFGATYAFSSRVGDRHPGVDIKCEKGEDVHPIGDGKIAAIRYDSKGYGNYVIVEHQMENDSKVYSVYAHLDPDSVVDLTEGLPVTKESTIGKIGESGNWGKAYHLHLEVRTEAGYHPWKTYADALKDNWTIYWLDPTNLVGNSNYGFKPAASP